MRLISWKITKIDFKYTLLRCDGHAVGQPVWLKYAFALRKFTYVDRKSLPHMCNRHLLVNLAAIADTVTVYFHIIRKLKYSENGTESSRKVMTEERLKR